MLRKILLNIEATSRCPASCSMCPRELLKNNGNLSIETMQKLVSQVDSDFVWEMDLAGRGEPTIHPEFSDLLRLMKVPGVTSGVVTTGVAMTQRTLDALVNDADIIRLSVSSVVPDCFNKVHIGLKFDRIWNNIARLAEAAADKVTIHLTGGPVIYETLPQTVEHLRKLGFEKMHLLPLWNRGGFFDSRVDMERRKDLMKALKLSPSEKEYSNGGKLGLWADVALGKFENSKFCPVGSASLSIAFNGEILGCFQDFGHTSLIGNVLDGSLFSHLQRRRKMLGAMKVCEGCDSHRVALL